MCFFFVVLFPIFGQSVPTKKQICQLHLESPPRLEDSLQILEFDVEVGCADGYYGDAPKVSRFHELGGFGK